MNNIQFSKDCVELLKQFEGIKLKPYLDTRGIPTIGIGSTTYNDGTKVTMQDPEITLDQAEDMCLYHLNQIELPNFQKHITTDLKQCQIDALGSICYNIGETGFDNSTLLKDINQHLNNDTIKLGFEMWKNAGGKPILLKRRDLEYQHFISC